MIPRFAALSIAEISVRIWSASGFSVERAAFCIVRKRVTALRFRSVRLIFWRDRLAADFVLAIGDKTTAAREHPARAGARTFYSVRASLFFARPQALRPCAYLRLSECRYSPWIQADLDSRLRSALVVRSALDVEVARPRRSERHHCSWAVPVAPSLLSAVGLGYAFDSQVVPSQPREY